MPTAWVRKIVEIIFDGLAFEDAEVSIVFTDDVSIHALNKKWRGKDKPTDVLSFSQMEGGPSGLISFGELNPLLGDVVISTDTAQRQANAAGCSLEEEVIRLLVHGVLHLLGYDHIRGGRQAAKMKREEKRLFELIQERCFG